MHPFVGHLDHFAVLADDEQRADRVPLAPLASDFDRQVHDPAQSLQRHLRLQTLQVSRGQAGQTF